GPFAGGIQGNVTQGGAPVAATVTVNGLPGGVSTDPSGNYNLNDIPVGSQTVRATLVSDPLVFQEQSITVIAGVTTTVNFMFP
ncbi:MAG: carboxypeptidase regulatory-like domain-containing protein, partial [Bacteroidota bacterium]